MRLSRKNISIIGCLFLEAIIIAAVLMQKNAKNVNDALSIIGFVAIPSGILTTYLVYKIYKKINFFVLFIGLSFIFSFGQSMLVFFGVELPVSAFSISSSGFFSNELIGSALFSFIGIISTSIGYCLCYRKRTIKTDFKPEIEKNNRMCTVAWVLLIISIAPSFYLLYQDIIVAMTYGYGYTLEAYTGLARICSLISGLFISALLMLFCFENRKIKRRVFWVILISYVILQLLGGSRLTVFRLGITLIVIYACFFKKLDRKKLIALIIGALIVGFVFSIVSNVRIYLTGGNIAEVLSDAITKVWENNFFFSIIREMGITQIINTLVYANCPNPVGFQYGFSYLKILWAILPNLMGSAYTGYIGVDITFSPLYKLTNSGLGASYLCEAYWNFGWFSILFFLLLGYLFGILESKFDSICNSVKVNPIKLFIISYIIYYMIFMVRSEMLGFGRAFVYYALIPALLCKIKFKDSRKNARA